MQWLHGIKIISDIFSVPKVEYHKKSEKKTPSHTKKTYNYMLT